jgi:hypothetical protein
VATLTVTINGAPVLTLWATVVAGRLGDDPETALTLGKAVAGLHAQSNGRPLEIFEEPQGAQADREANTRQPGDPWLVSLLHRRVPVIRTDQGMRATINGQPIDPAGVKRDLAQMFGHELAETRAAMDALAKAYPSNPLAAYAYALCTPFRPDVPAGGRGWGAAGPLDLDAMRALAK